MATLLQIGPKYVVLSAKTVDGWPLWPSKQKNDQLQVVRDVVGEFSNHLRKNRMKFGVAFSGGVDYSVNLHPKSGSYLKYMEGQLDELMSYNPDILWSSTMFPDHFDSEKFFSKRYNENENLVINNKVSEKWSDFTSVDMTPDEFSPPKGPWEVRIPVGNSIGLNKIEHQKTYKTSQELIIELTKVLSLGGNALFSLGLDSRGSVPSSQLVPMMELGRWIKKNAECIFDTRAWKTPKYETQEGITVYFTAKYMNDVYTDIFALVEIEDIARQEFEIPKTILEQNIDYYARMIGQKLDGFEQTHDFIKFQLPKLSHPDVVCIKLMR